MKNLIITALCSICIFTSNGFATSLVTAENYASGSLARAIDVYRIMNQGRLPTSWEQIKQVYDLNVINKKLMGRQGYPIEDHYEFIVQPMPFRSHNGALDEGSQVLLMRTVPLENLSEPDQSKRKQWRYLIVQSKDGEITSTRLPEEDVQAMLKSAGVTLTPKPGLPAAEADEPHSENEPTRQPNPTAAESPQQQPALEPSRQGEQSKVQSPQAPVAPQSTNWFLFLGLGLTGLLAAAAAWKFLRK